MSYLKWSFLVWVALMLYGCATPNVSSDYRLSEASGHGLVIGSVTYGGRLSEYKIFYRQIPTGKSGFFKAGQGQIPPFPRNDFSGNGTGAVGELFSAQLPAGRYEFFTWGIHSGAANTQSEPFSIEFIVTAGQPIYLGNFHFLSTSTLGLTVIGANVYHRQQSEIDIALFKRKYPQLAQQPIQMALPTEMPDQRLRSGYHTKVFLIMP